MKKKIVSPAGVTPLFYNQFDDGQHSDNKQGLSRRSISVRNDMFVRIMPDPYPSRSALQQSFAMITDSAYSSADSGFSEYVAWKKRESKRQKEIKKKNNNNSIIDEYHQYPEYGRHNSTNNWTSVSQDENSFKDGTWSSSENQQHKSWPRNINGFRKIEGHRIICEPRWSFDADNCDDSYYTRERYRSNNRGRAYVNPINASEVSSLNNSMLRDPIVPPHLNNSGRNDFHLVYPMRNNNPKNGDKTKINDERMYEKVMQDIH